MSSTSPVPPALLERVEGQLGRRRSGDGPASLAEELARIGYAGRASRGVLYARPRTRLRGAPYQLLLAPRGDTGAAAVVVAALGALAELGLEPTVTPVVLAGDDRRLLRLLARHAARVLVLGPAADADGRVWTARRGRSRFLLTVRDENARPWTSTDACARAVLELAKHVPRLYALADPVAGVTVEVSAIRTQPRRNGDAPSASVGVTILAPTARALRRIEANVYALEPLDRELALETTGGCESPPMERLARTRALYGAAVRLGGALGLHVDDAPTAATPSLANETNAYAATLDGLGPVVVGGRVDEASAAGRVALVALLLLERQSVPRLRHRRRRNGGRIAVVGGAANESNLELVAGWQALGLDADLIRPADVRLDDLVLGRLDVLPTLDGVEPGLLELLLLERCGLRVLNGAFATVRAHDKLLTARSLARAAVPHPWTVHLPPSGRLPLIAPPLVVKPRFGSWGGDVHRCESRAELDACLAEIGERRWFRRHGALLQALVPPVGRDLRLLVAGGTVVGGIQRMAAEGEWRTNISLGGTWTAVEPPAEACRIGLAAAAAVGADLVGVDLLPLDGTWTVLELNGAVEFDAGYALDGSDVFRTAAGALGLLPAERRSAARVLAGAAG
jgi:RimK family alpha-L-glutamate ligase